MSISGANAEAVGRIRRGNARLTGVRLAKDVVPALRERKTLLHAGPPVAWENMCGTMRGAMIGAMLFEGWAKNPAEAEALHARYAGPRESLRLLAAARDLGIRRMLVTHPLMSFTRFTVPEMKDALRLGALLEFDALSCCATWHDPVPVTTTAQAIRAVGARHCVLATDGGQSFNPPPVEMLRRFVLDLRGEGLSAGDLGLMTCENPARVVGL